jgi:glycosyltransferase involved in cell wall biosynthesis
MRLLFVGNIQSVHLRRWVSAALAAGDEVAVCSFVRGRSEARVDVLRTFGLGKAAYLLGVPQLKRAAEQFRPDIVHAHYLTSYGAVAALAGLHPLLVTAWGSDLLPVTSTTPFHRWAARRAVEGADLVTVVADHMKGPAVMLGADPNRLETVVFGLDLQLFKPKPTTPANRVPVVICTRNFDHVYRVDTLIAALAHLRHEGRHVDCRLIGDGPRRRQLQRAVRRLEVASAVAFLGRREPCEIANELSSADVFVSPSISDGNNVSLTEALACGAFPIATDIPANRQWIEPGVTGLLFPPGDARALARALAMAFDSPELRARARWINLEAVRQKANWETEVARMRGLYRRVLDARAPQRGCRVGDPASAPQRGCRVGDPGRDPARGPAMVG